MNFGLVPEFEDYRLRARDFVVRHILPLEAGRVKARERLPSPP